jgi:hypothetical protein
MLHAAPQLQARMCCNHHYRTVKHEAAYAGAAGAVLSEVRPLYEQHARPVRIRHDGPELPMVTGRREPVWCRADGAARACHHARAGRREYAEGWHAAPRTLVTEVPDSCPSSSWRLCLNRSIKKVAWDLVAGTSRDTHCA